MGTRGRRTLLQMRFVQDRDSSIHMGKWTYPQRYIALFFGILFGNLVVFPFGVTVYDEISCLIFLIFTVLDPRARKGIFQEIRNLRVSSPHVLLALYFIFHALASFLNKPSIESLKWLAFYTLLFNVYLAVRTCELRQINRKLVAVGFASYSVAIITLYFVSEFLLNVNFFDNQSKLISGTSTYICSYAILYFYIANWKSQQHIVSNSVLFFLAYYSIYLSDSRTGLIMTQTLIIWLCVAPQLKLLARLLLLISFIMTISIVPLLHEEIKDFSKRETLEPVGILWEQSPVKNLGHFSGSIGKGISFFVKSSTSDIDRKLHFNCVVSEFSKAKIEQKIFGFGTSEHRFLIGSCLSGKAGSYASSISVARLLLDYGAMGALLYLFILLTTLGKHILSRNYFASILVGQLALMSFFQDQGNLIFIWLLILCPNLLSSTKPKRPMFLSSTKYFESNK